MPVLLVKKDMGSLGKIKAATRNMAGTDAPQQHTMLGAPGARDDGYLDGVRTLPGRCLDAAGTLPGRCPDAVRRCRDVPGRCLDVPRRYPDVSWCCRDVSRSVRTRPGVEGGWPPLTHLIRSGVCGHLTSK